MRQIAHILTICQLDNVCFCSQSRPMIWFFHALLMSGFAPLDFNQVILICRCKCRNYTVNAHWWLRFAEHNKGVITENWDVLASWELNKLACLAKLRFAEFSLLSPFANKAVANSAILAVKRAWNALKEEEISCGKKSLLSRAQKFTFHSVPKWKIMLCVKQFLSNLWKKICGAHVVQRRSKNYDE